MRNVLSSLTVFLLVLSVICGMAVAAYTDGEVFSREERGYVNTQEKGDDIHGFGYQERNALGDTPIFYGEPFKLNYKAKIKEFELDSSDTNQIGPGFWIQNTKNGVTYKFTPNNSTNDVFSLVIPPGEYYVFPELKKGEVTNTIELEVTLIEGEQSGTTPPVPSSGDINPVGEWKVTATDGHWFSVRMENAGGNTYNLYLADRGNTGDLYYPYLTGEKAMYTMEDKGDNIYESTFPTIVSGQARPLIPITVTFSTNSHGSDSSNRAWERLK